MTPPDRPPDRLADATPAEGTDPFAPHGERWRAGRPRRLHDNPWFELDVYDAVAPTGSPATYYGLHFKAAATGVVPLHDDGAITLVGQWRFPFGTYSWELPEGGAPLHETPLDGARRELREEAGLTARDWRHILTMQLSNASSDEVAYLYLATGLEAVPAEPEATEALTAARVPFRTALAAVADGRIQDAITVAALLRLHHMAVSGDLGDALARLVLG